MDVDVADANGDFFTRASDIVRFFFGGVVFVVLVVAKRGSVD
jgi:hypothetical protein